MKKLLMLGAMLVVCVPPALAAGQIHLAWNDCGSFGSSELNNPCNSNIGSRMFIGSMIPPSVPQLEGMEGFLDIAEAGPISPWWRFDAAGCRSGVMTGSFSFGALPGSCGDPWLGAALGSLLISYPDNANSMFIPGNSERLDIQCAIGTTIPVDGSQEWYVFEISFARVNTLGPAACSGCNTPTIIYFDELLLDQPAGSPGGNSDLTGDGTGQRACYNGACDNYTPTESRSWGAIKALYH